MTTFAPSSAKTNPPLQLFTMFPASGTSALKAFTPSFGTAVTGGNGSSSERHHIQHHHHHLHSQQQQHQRVEGEEGPVEAFQPVRPARHVQHAAQWAETQTTVAPGLIVRSTTATVSQWSEYSTSSIQQTTEVSRTSSMQFQTIRTQTVGAMPEAMTSAQYLDDLKLPTQQLDLAVQLGKGSIARKGSLGGRRPPTIRCRRSSQGSMAHQDTQETMTATTFPEASVPPTNGTDSFNVRNGRNKTPPPRPPPPVFRHHPEQPRPHSPDNPGTGGQWNGSTRSGTPPSLPTNSPPPLPEREDLEFDMELPSSISSSSPSPVPGMTDVVEINDKESVGEDGEVVRRRTIITLGPRIPPPTSSGSTNSINVIFNSPKSSSQPELAKTEGLNGFHLPAETPILSTEEPHRPMARASAFNARRTIEQRRQQQIQSQPLAGSSTSIESQTIQTAAVQPSQAVKTPPSSTYLYGEQGSPASSFGGSSLRTMSISMSFDDLGSNASTSVDQQRRGGRNRTEAWYERRQSYGFEAADKLQSLLNTSGSSDVPSTGAISRSCDSLSSTVRSTSSAIEKMIPPWIKNASPVSSRQAEEDAKSSVRNETSPPSSFYSQSVNDMAELLSSSDPIDPSGESSPIQTSSPIAAQPATPTPSLQRSESSRSATNVLEESEPIWLRDLRLRRSLRDGRRKPPVIKSPPPMETPVWLGVKLRPTGLSLVDPDPSSPSGAQPSPTKPHTYTPIFTFTNTGTSSKIQTLLRNSRDHLHHTLNQVDDPARETRLEPEGQAAVVVVPVTQEPSGPTSKDNLVSGNNQHSVPKSSSDSIQIKLPVKARKTSSSIVMINSSRESLYSLGATDAGSSVSETGSQLNHRKSIELMRMLEETPLVSGHRPFHDRMDSASGVTETGSVYSTGDWTECSSVVTSVKNSNEDLTQNPSDQMRKTKKVAFGADVKEESDQKRSRPRRIRSRSPESRLRQWQEKLEEVKSITHGIQLETSSVNEQSSTVNGLPLKLFGDDKSDHQSEPVVSTTTTSSTSETFRSLLQARKPYTITTPVVNESVVIDTYPLMRAFSSSPAAESKRPSTVIRNGIVNFDASVERKIVILETETVPAPKSILKKRSIENLLDSTEPPVATAPAPVPFSTFPSVQSGIKVSMTNQKKEPPLALRQQEDILPWRIHLKHVEPGIKVNVPEVISNESSTPVQPPKEVPPWKAEISRKRTPPFRSSTPERVGIGRSPSVASESSNISASSAPIPGMSAAELIRNIRPSPPVMMVARCEVRESVFRPPVQTETDILSSEHSVKADYGYHSLEADVDSGGVKRQFRKTHEESKTIDETIAQLNETIEEIRSVDIRTETPTVEPTAKRESSPPIQATHSVKKSSSSSIPDSRFIVREIRPSIQNETTVSKSQSSSYIQSSFKATSHQSSYAGSQDEVQKPSPFLARHNLRKSSTTGLTGMASTTRLSGSKSPLLKESPDHSNEMNKLRTSQTTSTTVLKQKDEQQSFMMAPGVVRDKNASQIVAEGLATGVPQFGIPNRRKSSTERSAELPNDAKVEELVNKFESSSDILPTVDSGIRKRSMIQTVSSSRTFNSRISSTSSTNRCRAMETPIKTSYSTVSSSPTPIKLPLSTSKCQPAKRSNSIELTSGMPEDKAALLVRKFFGNSVIETKKSRITKTETIIEEASEMSYNSSFNEDKPEAEEMLVKAVNASFDSDDIFRPSSRTEGMSTSSFGSALDIMETTTDDDRSTRSSTTMTNTTRYSSCSERSVKLSDIINRPDRAPLTDSAPSSPPATPVEEFSCATSESTSIPFSFSRTTTDSSSTGSASLRSVSTRSGSIRRNKTQRHPTVIRRDRTNVPAAAAAAAAVRTTTTPKLTRSRPSSSALTGTRSSASASPSTLSSSSTVQRRRSDRKLGDSLKPVVSKPSVNRLSAVPVRPPRVLQPVNPSVDVKKRTSSRTSASSTTRSSSTMAPSSSTTSSSRIRTSTASRSVPAVPSDQKVLSSSGSHIPLASRTNRLVTITSYKSKVPNSGKAEEINAVSGVRVTPIAVGSSHYKIRMDQRLAAAIEKTLPSKTSAHQLKRPSTTSSTGKRTNSSKTKTKL